MRFSQLLREPILHFLLIGIALFGVYGWLAPADRSGLRIVISQPMVDEMAREYQALWGRPPGDQELSSLVEAYVRDEILFREGQALGLDRDDPVIKRRVRQKLELIAEEQSGADVPTNADLSAYLTQNASRFMQPMMISFEQIFFAGSGTPADVEQAVAAAQAALTRGADSTKLGQASLLPGRMDDASIDVVERDFGVDFAEKLQALPLEEWTGPIASGFGAHLVRVTTRTPAVLPSLEAIRPLVVREWENERRGSSRSDSYKALRSSYDVVIDAKLPAAVVTP